ncbi:MAG: aminodeoxychorismate lyase, partial [Gammaproteobacteria bacterium]|nr:aminodeoxychorismate lyase [Gammaproteobacteria bacterium]
MKITPYKKSATNLINGINADFISVNDRSIHYGDGLFETILCVDNKLYYWSQHYRRLSSSAALLKLDCPSEEFFLRDISRLTAESNSQHDQTFAIKILLSRGTGQRGYRIDQNTSVNRIVLSSPLETDYSSLLSETLLSGELYICKQQVSINESLAGLKHLNRLENVMARSEWSDDKQSYIDGLMLNANQHVIEGTMSNLFAIKHGQLYTPELKQSGIKGVMRDIIIGIANKLDLRPTVTCL